MTEIGASSGGMSRRSFFEGLAALGGVSLAMSGMEALGFGFTSNAEGPPKLDGEKKASVIVLGAGLAGLTAAYELGKAGYSVTVIESRAYAGGRCQSARKGFSETDLAGNSLECQFDDGLYINHGPWRIPFHHHSTLHYTKAFKIPLENFVNDNDNSYVFFEKGVGPLAGKPIRKGQIAADIRGYTSELMAKVASKGNLDAPMSEADKEAFIAYLIHEGSLSPKDLAYTGAEGRGFDVLPGAGVDPGPGVRSKPFPLSDVLGSKAWLTLGSVSGWEQQRTMLQPVGGMDQLAKGFEAHVRETIRYSTYVTAVKQDGKGVTVQFRGEDGKKGQVKGDYVLCTIPLSVAKNIDMAVSKPFKAAMDGVSYAAVNKIGLQMKSRFWEDKHGIYGGHVYTDMPGIGSISLPSTNWQGEKGVLLGYYAFGGEAARVSARSPTDRAAFAVAAGQKIFPEYAENFENAFSYSWHLSKHNLGGWAEWSEDGRANAYPLLCKPDGRIYLAGEHLSYLGGWQAGAIESAWQQIAAIHKRVQAA